MQTEYTVLFRGFDCTIHLHHYKDNGSPGGIQMELRETETGELIAVATTNVPGFWLRPNQVIIKNYSENEGITEVLRDAGIIEPTPQWVKLGYTSAQVCKLLIPIPDGL